MNNSSSGEVTFQNCLNSGITLFSSKNSNKSQTFATGTYQRLHEAQGGGPRIVVSTAAFHARVRGSVPGLGGLKETKLFLPHPRVKVNIVGSLRD